MSRAHSNSDPFLERLSDYLDGELEGEARSEVERHLAGCAPCRRVLDQLQALVEAARALPDHEPERDAWPAIEAALARHPARRPWALVLAFAAGVLVTLALQRALGTRAEAQARYLLLLHEPVGFSVDESTRLARVERYRNWLNALGAQGLGGGELDAAGTVLSPGGGSESLALGDRIGGYFLLAARDEAEARDLAGACPHLEQGGRVELRHIRRD